MDMQQYHNAIPDLANRVFALREKFYFGCRYHYSLEKNLAFLIDIFASHILNTKELEEEGIVVAFELLKSSLEKAERSAWYTENLDSL